VVPGDGNAAVICCCLWEDMNEMWPPAAPQCSVCWQLRSSSVQKEEQHRARCSAPRDAETQCGC